MPRLPAILAGHILLAREDRSINLPSDTMGGAALTFPHRFPPSMWDLR